MPGRLLQARYGINALPNVSHAGMEPESLLERFTEIGDVGGQGCEVGRRKAMMGRPQLAQKPNPILDLKP